MQQRVWLISILLMSAGWSLSGAPGFAAEPTSMSSADDLSEPIATSESSILTGTQWHLLQFQSMDDAQGILKPADPSLYTMELLPNGRLVMQLNCNRAMGVWTARSGPAAESGGFRIPRLAATRALCPPPRLGEHFARQSEHIRSYLLQDDKLHLSLMADGGIYTWQRTSLSEEGDPIPAPPDEGGTRVWQVREEVGGLNLRQRPSVSSKVLTAYAPGTLLDNHGCQQSEGRIWCSVQRLGGGPVGYVSARHLRPAITPDGQPAFGPDDSALRAGRGEFDATGDVPCAQARDQATAQCPFSVARSGGGFATVVITRPDGGERVIFFRMGIPIGAGTSQADGYPEFEATKENDLHRIRVGSERYEIPDAVVLGG